MDYKTLLKKHAASFAKTYVTVFLGIYLFGIDNEGYNMFDPTFLLTTAQYAFLSVLRTAYKVVSEDVK